MCSYKTFTNKNGYDGWTSFGRVYVYGERTRSRTPISFFLHQDNVAGNSKETLNRPVYGRSCQLTRRLLRSEWPVENRTTFIEPNVSRDIVLEQFFFESTRQIPPYVSVCSLLARDNRANPGAIVKYKTINSVNYPTTLA